MSQAPELHVLLIAEVAEDIETLQTAIEHNGRMAHCTVRTTLPSAMDFIDGLEQVPSLTPQLIVMCMDARRLVLMSLVVEAKRNPRLRSIPTVVLLEGNSAYDVNALYEMNVNCVLPKNVVLDDEGVILENMCRFWLDSILLPQHPLRVDRLVR